MSTDIESGKAFIKNELASARHEAGLERFISDFSGVASLFSQDGTPVITFTSKVQHEESGIKRLFTRSESNYADKVELEKLLLFLADVYDSNPHPNPLELGDLEHNGHNHSVYLGSDLIRSSTAQVASLLSQVLSLDISQGKGVFTPKFYDELRNGLVEKRNANLRNRTAQEIMRSNNRLIGWDDTNEYVIEEKINSQIPQVPDFNSDRDGFISYLKAQLAANAAFCDELVDLLLFARAGLVVPGCGLPSDGAGIIVSINGTTQVTISRPEDGRFAMAYREAIPAPSRLSLDRIQIQVGGKLVIKPSDDSKLKISSSKGLLTFEQLKKFFSGTKNATTHSSDQVKTIDDRVFSDLLVEVPEMVKVRLASSGGEVNVINMNALLLSHIGLIEVNGRATVEMEECQGELIVRGVDPTSTTVTTTNCTGDTLRASDATINIKGPTTHDAIYMTECEGQLRDRSGARLTLLSSPNFRVSQ